VAGLNDQSATELIAKIRQGETTPTEILDACFARIDAVDSKLHAFTIIERESALATAKEITARIKQKKKVGRLMGLPLA